MQKTTTALWLLALFLLPGGLAGEALVLVDDREEPLGAPVEVCFVRGMGTECVEVGPEAGRVELRELDLLRIEGPDHGPVTVRARDLPDPEEGEARLAVPRKATLRVRGATDQRLTAALHSTEDLDPTRPDHSLAVPPGGELKVPAGDWLLVLESRGAAPALHELAALPGSTHSVGHRPRAGWSLVVRAVAKEDETPVTGARVAVRVPRPAGAVRPGGDGVEEEQPPRTAQTGSAGLALFPGLEDPLVDAEVRHPDLVGTTLSGISSAPGVLEVREAVLVAGARLEAEIRVDGEAAAGWRCAVVDRTRAQAGQSREVGAMEAGEDGLCRIERLPEGPFWLRVTAPEGEGAAEREIRLYDGDTASVILDLSPIRVEGEVRKGEEPAAGYRVRIFRSRETGATYYTEPVAEAVTDEDGAYETTLWDAGPHWFSLHDPQGRSADSEGADVDAPVTRVDFHLAAGDVEGVVVDEQGRPIPSASVVVRWKTSASDGATGLQAGEDGTFRLPREAGAGELEVTARHPGYEPATVRLTLTEDAEPPTLLLTLRRDSVLRGRVVTAAGAPAAGVLVLSAGRGPGSLGSEPPAATDGQGRFEVTRSPATSTRLYATGRGCPLMTADVPAEAPEPVVLTCAAAAGTLRLRFVGSEGQPVSGLSVALRRGGETFSSSVLGGHLYSLGQATASDGSGRLVIPGLSPGTYHVELVGFSTAGVAFSGDVGSVAVLPGQAQELEVVVSAR